MFMSIGCVDNDFTVTLDDVSFDGKTIPKIYDFEYIPQQIPVQNSQSTLPASTDDNNQLNTNSQSTLPASTDDSNQTNTRTIDGVGVVTNVKDIKPAPSNTVDEQNVNDYNALQNIKTKEQLIKENVGEMSSQEIVEMVEDWVNGRIKKSCENNTNIQGDGLQQEKAVVKVLKIFADTANNPSQ